MIKRLLPFIDWISFVAAVVIFVYVYSWQEGRALHQLAAAPDQVSSLAVKVLNAEGCGTFVALLAALAVVRRRVRLIAGVWIMYLFLLLYIPVYVVPSLQNWFDWLAAIVSLSFVICGCAGAVGSWIGLDALVTVKRGAPPAPRLSRAAPPSSRGLLFLSVLSIPFVYLSLAVSCLVPLGIALWCFSWLTLLPWLPGIFLNILALPVLLGVWAVWRAGAAVFFARPQDPEPAQKIDVSAAPALRAIIDEVCRRLGTRFPDQVLLHVEPTAFVSQLPLKTFDGVVEGRTLALGLPLLRQLDPRELRAILAHEFAHFTGRDSLYASYILPLATGLDSAIQDLTLARDDMDVREYLWMRCAGAVLFFPRLFLHIILAYFIRINRMLSRGRELRADGIAARLYGRAPFASGLKKISAIGRHYQEYMQNPSATEGDVLARYDAALTAAGDLDQYVKQALEEEEQADDSHPCLTTRLNHLPAGDPTTAAAGETNAAVLAELASVLESLSYNYQEALRRARRRRERFADMV